ncbi:acyl-CoA dehydrogenase family protein [Amycolatopsis sp. 195334CR]|uniref:acyl-CoA dehydrogenase family protein n=1 Tax=Amycolatopsis sp. 195334CR TaxID=2814588 RepID=UPI001A8DD859|nr:acyl-CoA dehydrogenase family protein [Amycolatopsis sp. 195334CR]MBN6041437.1 acyl-CoA dehydrogenase [Amycolatopsis sp. 195334CR]
MRFALSAEQQDFAAAIDAYLSTADCDAAARSWAEDDLGPGMKLWHGLTDLGLLDLLDAGGSLVDLVVAVERLGYHAVPGPWVDTAAVLPALSIESGGRLASVVAPPHVPYGLDADVADVRLMLTPDGTYDFAAGERLSSVDRVRRLFEPERGNRVGDAVALAFEHGALATAAQLLGAGQWLLDTSVTYAKQRKQYGREIGGYQAIKHLLADAVTALELARPLLHAAALTAAPRDVSAAKVAAGQAAALAAKTGLQVHGAIGYTAEHGLGLRLTKVRALAAAWGTPAFHRGRVLA